MGRQLLQYGGDVSCDVDKRLGIERAIAEHDVVAPAKFEHDPRFADGRPELAALESAAELAIGALEVDHLRHRIVDFDVDAHESRIARIAREAALLRAEECV